MVVADLGQTLYAPLCRGSQGQRCLTGTAREATYDLLLLAEMAQVGQYCPVIHATYPFDEIQQAHRVLDDGHKHGSVVVRF